MRRSRCIIRSSDLGQAMLEFAMTSVVFFMLVFGITNFSLAVYTFNQVSYAAREGTRYASVRGATAPAPAGADDVAAFVKGEWAGANPANLTVSTTWNPDNNPGSFVVVDVQYTFNFVMPFVNLPQVSMESTSQLAITQ
jgi:Flp pilus assembly protein TadG